MKNNESEFIAEIGKEVVKDVYEDGLKKTVNATGDSIALLLRTIKAVFAPLEKWVLNKEYNVKETQKLLENKLRNISPENIVTPEPHIAVPALQCISYCMDNEELREMYANLLANSMNKIVKNGVHPGFVELIKQLSPDEAKIMKSVMKEVNVPIVTVRLNAKAGGGIDLLSDFSDIGERSGCENPAAIEQYFDNLERLGLVARKRGSYLTDENNYKSLEEHPAVVSKMNANFFKDSNFEKTELKKEFVLITAFGKQFCKICLNTF